MATVGTAWDVFHGLPASRDKIPVITRGGATKDDLCLVEEEINGQKMKIVVLKKNQKTKKALPFAHELTSTYTNIKQQERSYIRPTIHTRKPKPDELVRVNQVDTAVILESIRERSRKLERKLKKKKPSFIESENKNYQLCPIYNFDFYSKTILKQAESRYKVVVSNLKHMRNYGFPIKDAVDELGNAMILIENEKKRLEELRILDEKIKMEEEEKLQKEKELEKEPLPDVNFDTIVEIKKGGKTSKVKPIAVLHKKYFSKGIRPPIAEKVRMYHLLGFPEWYLVKMIEGDEKANEKKKILEKILIDVFAKYDGKKTSKPKPKSLIKKMLPSRPKPKAKPKKEEPKEDEPKEDEPEEDEPEEDEPEEDEPGEGDEEEE
jgi:hypothetical protein